MDWDQLAAWASSPKGSRSSDDLLLALQAGGVPQMVELLRNLSEGEPDLSYLERPAALALIFWRLHGSPVNAGESSYHRALLEELDAALTDVSSAEAMLPGLLEAVQVLVGTYGPYAASSGTHPAQFFSDALVCAGQIPPEAVDQPLLRDSGDLRWLCSTVADLPVEVTTCLLPPARYERSLSLLGGRSLLLAAAPGRPLRTVRAVLDPGLVDDEVLLLTSDGNVTTHVPPPPLRGEPQQEWRYHELRSGGTSPSDAYEQVLAEAEDG